MAETGGEEKALLDPIHQLIAALRERRSDADAARKALDPLVKNGALKSIPTVEKSLGKLRSSPLLASELGEVLAPIIDALAEDLRRLRLEGRQRVLGELDQLARNAELSWELIADNPPTLFIPPLEIELDISRGAAHVLYARERVRTTELSASAILEGRLSTMQAIREQATGSEMFFDLLAQAYRVVLLRSGLPLGERVDMVDLLAPLGLMRIEQSRWRSTRLGKSLDYPRYLLSYQLNRLRKDGVLERNGLRVDLGTASGGAARRKKNVLFVQTSPRDGQYYLSIALHRTA